MALYRTLNEEEQTSLRDHYRENDLFRHWSPILCQLERDCGGRDAISLWACSERCLNQLREKSQYRETEIDYILRELLQETDVITAVTIMCIVLMRLMNAVERDHENETFNNEPMCTAIMSILMNNPAYKPTYDAITNIFFRRKIGFDDRPVVIQPSDPMNETLIMEDVTNEDKKQSNKMKQFDTDTDDIQMSEDYKPTYFNEQRYNNCQQFFGPISNCTFMMPAATQSSKQKQNASKPKPKAGKKPNGKPMTLKYYTHGNKGVLKKQRTRVHQVFHMWERWGWIDVETAIDDFDAFFEGEPRHCNITWKANGTILTILLQELLEQSYIEKQSGCAAKSLVEQQFGKTANSDRNRLDSISEERIKLTLLVLDPQNHDLIFQSSDDLSEIQDVQDAVLKEIFAGKLRSTKGI